MQIDPEPYHAITARNIEREPEWQLLSDETREAVRVVSRVLPFRTNRFVLRELIDWNQLPHDPIFQLVFPQRQMLDPEDYRNVRRLLRSGDAQRLETEVAQIHGSLNPHPAGQVTHNVPTHDGRPLHGLQHKYKESVLVFPAPAQTCHAYCGYCYRWPQFVRGADYRFSARDTSDLTRYLRSHPEVTDVIVTGGDPLIMSTAHLRRFIEPLLAPEFESVRNIRIGSKVLAYWPQRLVTDNDADECLRLFERVVAAGRHLTLMAHCSHPVEMGPGLAREAIARVRSTGAEIRMQAPLIRHVNDDASVWSRLWREGVSLGMIPYYMFIERNTGARRYFEIPLARSYDIFREAYTDVSGIARTVRGPSMSDLAGKVRVAGISKVRGERVFVLELIQARNPDWVGRPFFAAFDPEAVWFDELQPAFGESEFFFEAEMERRFRAAPAPARELAESIH